MTEPIHRKKTLFLFILLGILITLFYGINVTYASEAAEFDTSEASESLPYLYDNAKLLSDEETDNILARCKSLSEQYDINILIVTNASEDNDPKKYVEDLYDENEAIWNDAVILYVNMTSRGVRIDGFGSCEYIFDTNVIDSMLDNITPYLADEDCYSAMSQYLSDIDSIMSKPASSSDSSIAESSNNENSIKDSSAKNSSSSFVKLTFVNLLIALIISGIAVGIMAYNSTGRMTANGSSYIDPKNSKILGQWDRYIRTTTTRVPKPKHDSNDTKGFGGGGGISSGGNSHSGGGRNF